MSFDDFWNAYGYKKAPKLAERAYRKAILDGVSSKDIIAGAERARKHDKHPYRKYPATWLNGGCWLDETKLQNMPSADLTADLGWRHDQGVVHNRTGLQGGWRREL